MRVPPGVVLDVPVSLRAAEEALPSRSVPVSFRFAKRPKYVYLAPSREGLIFDIRGDRCDVVVPEVRGHAMVAFE